MEGGKTQESSADEGAEEDGDCDEVEESTIISTSYLPASYRMRETRRYLLKEREENLPNNSKMAANSTILTSFRSVLKNRLHGFISDLATCNRAKSVTSSNSMEANKLQGSEILEEDESTVDRSFIPDALPKANTCYYP